MSSSFLKVTVGPLDGLEVNFRDEELQVIQHQAKGMMSISMKCETYLRGRDQARGLILEDLHR